MYIIIEGKGKQSTKGRGMKTNDLKKGTSVQLRNGWKADLVDNMKGNTRCANVFGDFTEMGSVYAHDIVAYKDTQGVWQYDIEYTPAQLNCRKMNRALFG